MHHRCSIGSTSIYGDVICRTTSDDFISELDKSDKAKTNVHSLISSLILPVFDRFDTGNRCSIGSTAIRSVKKEAFSLAFFQTSWI